MAPAKTDTCKSFLDADAATAKRAEPAKDARSRADKGFSESPTDERLRGRTVKPTCTEAVAAATERRSEISPCAPVKANAADGSERRKPDRADGRRVAGTPLTGVSGVTTATRARRNAPKRGVCRLCVCGGGETATERTATPYRAVSAAPTAVVTRSNLDFRFLKTETTTSTAKEKTLPQSPTELREPINFT